MSSLFPSGVAHIQISRKMEEDDTRYVFARLMTPEIERLIKRQNVDTANINCMMWPIVGLSRWATFQCLLTKRDVYNLMLKDPDVLTDQTFLKLPYSGFKIEMSANNGEKSGEESCYFSRMHLAKVQPLMASYLGISVPNANPELPSKDYGDAMFLCTFHCDRWAKRGNRLYFTEEQYYDGHLGMQYKSRSWDQSLISGSRNSLDNLKLKDLVELIVKDYLHQADPAINKFQPLFRDATSYGNWASVDVFVSEIEEEEDIPIGVDYLKSEPLTVALDRMLARSGYYISYLPKRGIGSVPFMDGAYNFHVAEISGSGSNAMLFVERFTYALIAGQFRATHIANPAPLNPLTRVWQIPSMITTCGDASPLVLENRTQFRATGVPPNVFSQMHDSTNPLLPAQSGQLWSGDFPDPFSSSIGETIINSSPNNGESNCVYLRKDDTLILAASPSGGAGSSFRKNIKQADSPGDVSFIQRYQSKISSGTCDLYFRSWNFPGRKIDATAAFQDWAGGTHMELRLQTSEDGGFGFPVTRIHGSIDDWILGPIPENTGSDIQGSGMVQTWRGEDGRMRVHVGMPFGIPCLLRIVGSTQITAGVPAWEYTAKIVQVDSYVEGEVTDYFGGISDYGTPNPESVVLAYNLAECANTSSFAGPGYALPLPAFSVLPVGTDRNGDEHIVIVQAHLYMPSKIKSVNGIDYTGPNTRAYFFIHNPIDGVCANPLLDPNDIDGGVF